MNAAPSWHRKFVESDEPRILLEGSHGCGKRAALLRAAARDVENPLYRAVILVSSREHLPGLVRATGSVYRDLLGQYRAEFGEWVFLSGATIRLAAGLHEARSTELYDCVAIEHIDEFPFPELVRAASLLRQGHTARSRLRATRRLDQDRTRVFPVRVRVETGEVAIDDALSAEPTTEALERLVVAITHHLHTAGSGATWDGVLDLARWMRDAALDTVTRELLRAIDTADGDLARLVATLERARHRLAEADGAEPGACHRTCAPDCSLRA